MSQEALTTWLEGVLRGSVPLARSSRDEPRATSVMRVDAPCGTMDRACEDLVRSFVSDPYGERDAAFVASLLSLADVIKIDPVLLASAHDAARGRLTAGEEPPRDPSIKVARKTTGSFASRGDLMLAALDFVLDEQLAGRRPTDLDVAEKFMITTLEAVELHDELAEMGELG